MIVHRIVVAAVLVLVLAGCSGAAASPVPASGNPSGATSSAAADYCVQQRGKVVHRVATWNTNADPTDWLTLSNALDLCEFETGTGDETTRISVDLGTLYVETPTLAAVAYLSKLPPPKTPQPGMNPGGHDCTAGLDGATNFGNGASGGGWVNADEPVFTVMNLCVFPDMSAIDEFGIFYYANGVVRGTDLADKFRCRPGDTLPGIFVAP